MEYITTSYNPPTKPLFLHHKSGNVFPLPEGIIPLTLISDERRASVRPMDSFCVWFASECAQYPILRAGNGEDGYPILRAGNGEDGYPILRAGNGENGYPLRQQRSDREDVSPRRDGPILRAGNGEDGYPFDDIQDKMKSRLVCSLHGDVVKSVPEIGKRYYVFVEGVPFSADRKICNNKREVVETIVWNKTTQRRLFAFPESKLWLVPHVVTHDFDNGCVAIVYEGNITAISQYWDLPFDFEQSQMESIADLVFEFWEVNNHKSFPLFTPVKRGNLVLHLAYDTELRKLVLVAPEDLPITGRAGLFDVEKDWELLSDPSEVSLRRVLRDGRDF